MGFGETILAKTQNLAVDVASESFIIAAFSHAVDQFAFVIFKSTLSVPGCHGSP